MDKNKLAKVGVILQVLGKRLQKPSVTEKDIVPCIVQLEKAIAMLGEREVGHGH